MKRVCIHGHFYQPPRQNPWLMKVHLQDSAYPYHDWNERVSAECYAPNAASRILGPGGRIARMVNNYESISFDFGPTLLLWMEENDNGTYKKILEADRAGSNRFSGHGPAIAMCYNHPIMPLATPRDKRTQVLWGIRDFEHRFGRRPEGMWLPETAVDLETLGIMAEEGIRFTILEPGQASRVRPLSGGEWQDVSGARVDTRRAYLCRLPTGGEITLFFYNGPLSRAVSFENVLKDGAGFAERLLEGLDPGSGGSDPGSSILGHIATDGENYGHHHMFAEMALSFCLDRISSSEGSAITVYGEYLDSHPPTHEAEIFENTSWSCVHGVQRWRADCGCTTGGHPGWHQKWRGPLREALDGLREEMDPFFESELSKLMPDPWAARDGFIDVVLDRSRSNVTGFLKAHAKRELSDEESTTALKLLEMSYQSMLMFTSCGWFFEDISGIETVQVMRHACRAVQLLYQVTGVDLEPGLLQALEKAESNHREMETGAQVYLRLVKPLELKLVNVAANFSLLSMFRPVERNERFYCYRVESVEREEEKTRDAVLVAGRCRVASDITWEAGGFDYCAIRSKGLDAVAAVVPANPGSEGSAPVWKDVERILLDGGFEEAAKELRRIEGATVYTLWDLYKDEQREVISDQVAPVMAGIQEFFSTTYGRYRGLMRTMREHRMPLPPEMTATLRFQLNTTLQAQLRKERPDTEQVGILIRDALDWGVDLDLVTMAFLARSCIRNLMEKLRDDPSDLGVLRDCVELFRHFSILDLTFRVWEAQNIYFEISKTAPAGQRSNVEADPKENEWREAFAQLGEFLGVHIE